METVLKLVTEEHSSILKHLMEMSISRNNQQNTKMKKLILIISFITLAACFVQAQNAGEFAVPLSDPAKRGKLRAHINYGSITVKGTARKDVLIKYSGEDDDDDDKHKDR